MGRLTGLDRRLGAAARERAGRVPGLRGLAALAARALSPGFRIAVAAMIARPRTRRAGLEALACGVVAALAARALRDRLGRPRPGARRDGGFPSRHAAAATAIARAAGRHDPALGRALGSAAALGLAGRVVTADHEPADIVAGAALGLAVAAAVERLAGRPVA
jgi:undecaprenyl-diphosphatase